MTSTRKPRKLSRTMLVALEHVGWAERLGLEPRWMGVSTQRTLTIAWLLLRGLIERGPDCRGHANYGLTDAGRTALDLDRRSRARSYVRGMHQ